MLSFSSVGDVIIFHGVNVIISEGPDVIIFKCSGYYHFAGVFCTAMCKFLSNPCRIHSGQKDKEKKGIWVVVCCYLL
jgi:hypothetical protein